MLTYIGAVGGLIAIFLILGFDFLNEQKIIKAGALKITLAILIGGCAGGLITYFLGLILN